MTDPELHRVSPTLGEYLANLSNNADNLRTDVHNAEQARRRANTIGLFLMAVLGVLMLVVLVSLARTNTVVHQTSQTNQRIADCTTAGGKCYSLGSKRTGQAIASILRAQIALGECSRLYPNESGPVYDQKLRNCVYDRMVNDPGPTAAVPSPTPGG